MSLNLSKIGILIGPSSFLLGIYTVSINSIKVGPLYQLHLDSSGLFLILAPDNASIGIT